MSVFYCHGCDRLVDSDFEECHQAPGNELECENCHQNRVDDAELEAKLGQQEDESFEDGKYAIGRQEREIFENRIRVAEREMSNE